MKYDTQVTCTSWNECISTGGIMMLIAVGWIYAYSVEDMYKMQLVH